MIEVDEDIQQEIEVLYQGQPINNLTLIQIEISNTGNRAIREDDYSRPITLQFPSDSKVVEAVVTKSQPGKLLSATILANNNTVLLPSTLFNGGDSAEMRFLVINLPEEAVEDPFSVDTHIAFDKTPLLV